MKLVTFVNKSPILAVEHEELMHKIHNATYQALNELKTCVEREIHEVQLRIKMNSQSLFSTPDSYILSALQKIKISIEQEITGRLLNPKTSEYEVSNKIK